MDSGHCFPRARTASRPREALPERDETYRDKIRAFYDRRRRLPSFTEIMGLCDFSSRGSAAKLVDRLVEEGFLGQDATGRLAFGRTFHDLRILGLVEAGFPSPAEEELADTMSLDEYLLPNKESSFILRVKGDSMKDAGIMEGDMVIVERRSDAKDGEIVIAEADGGWTMKYYRTRGSRPFLEPANPKYKPIIPKESLQIAAVVKAVVRKYQ
jgi:repressor LexA